jgi:cyclin-dependent kinase-like
MECYDQLGTIGEGTYGVVLKARHRESQQVVAIKKFKESDGEYYNTTTVSNGNYYL